MAAGAACCGAAGDWPRSFARAMAMADWHAPVSGTRERVVGNSNESAYEAHGSCADLFASRAFGCSSWIHQEDTVDTGRGFGFGAKAAEGDGAMSKKHLGSSIDDFLKDEGIFEEVQAQAVKEVVAWQLVPRLTACLIRRTTLRFQACSGPRRWWGGGSLLS